MSVKIYVLHKQVLKVTPSMNVPPVSIWYDDFECSQTSGKDVTKTHIERNCLPYNRSIPTMKEHIISYVINVGKTPCIVVRHSFVTDPMTYHPCGVLVSLVFLLVIKYFEYSLPKNLVDWFYRDGRFTSNKRG